LLAATFWGFVGGAALLVGAVLALIADVPRRVTGLVMAFGAGVLISALTFELTAEAYRRGGLDAAAVGLALGSLTFFLLDAAVDRLGGEGRKRSSGHAGGGGVAAGIVLGAILDGIPESVAIGASLLEGAAGAPPGRVSVAVVAAVFLSNVPEAMSAATGLKVRHSARGIMGMWTAVAVISALAAGLGYAVLGDASPNLVGGIQAFAAGAILTMLADTMMPEAFEAEGRSTLTGVVTTLGFALAALLTALG
jgi:ZIP family zinc transporter